MAYDIESLGNCSAARANQKHESFTREEGEAVIRAIRGGMPHTEAARRLQLGARTGMIYHKIARWAIQYAQLPEK